MNSTSKRHSSIDRRPSTKRALTKSRPQLISLQAECFYGLDRDSQGEAEDGSDRHQRPPVLTRYLRCRASLPDGIPLQNTSRMIAMLKCVRKVKHATKASAPPMLETVFSKFTRIWPRDLEEEELPVPASPSRQHALVIHNANSSIEFDVQLASDLPQSLEILGGGIYYTMQIQANLRHPNNITAETSMFSPELRIDIPAPEAAYAAARLPKRITNGFVGQAQDHYGILISPDISLHVSLPREILYSRKLHSVFKIHIKLMPHPPEAKLPGIAKLVWKVVQKTNLGSVQAAAGNNQKRFATSTSDLASGQILLPTQKNGSSEEAMSGSRKDQYLYIALPENSADLLPRYDGNKYLEILHYLDIELFPANEVSKGNTLFSKTAASFFSKTFSRTKKESIGVNGSSTNNFTSHTKQAWRASVPINLYSDTAEIQSRHSIGNVIEGKGKGKLQRLSITA